MVTKDYQEAFTEVLAIVEVDQNFKSRIPARLLELFKENASKTYEINFDLNLKIKDMPLKKETKGLLGMLYRNYSCNPDERKEYDKILYKNQALYEEELREKYNPDKIFEKQNIVTASSEPIQENNSMIVYKENIFTKLINKIKSFFSKASK